MVEKGTYPTGQVLEELLQRSEKAVALKHEKLIEFIAKKASLHPNSAHSNEKGNGIGPESEDGHSGTSALDTAKVRSLELEMKKLEESVAKVISERKEIGSHVESADRQIILLNEQLEARLNMKEMKDQELAITKEELLNKVRAMDLEEKMLEDWRNIVGKALELLKSNFAMDFRISTTKSGETCMELQWKNIFRSSPDQICSVHLVGKRGKSFRVSYSAPELPKLEDLVENFNKSGNFIFLLLSIRESFKALD